MKTTQVYQRRNLSSSAYDCLAKLIEILANFKKTPHAIFVTQNKKEIRHVERIEEICLDDSQKKFELFDENNNIIGRLIVFINPHFNKSGVAVWIIPYFLTNDGSTIELYDINRCDNLNLEISFNTTTLIPSGRKFKKQLKIVNIRVQNVFKKYERIK